MAITIICDCGQEIVATDEAAGSYMQCGQCGAWQKVPHPHPAEHTAPPQSQQNAPTPPAQEAQAFNYQKSNPYQQPVQAQNYQQQAAYPPYQPYAAPQQNYSQPYAISLARRIPAGNAPVILGVLGIAGHMMDCVMSLFSVAGCLVLSLLAVVLGIMQTLKYSEPHLVLNGRLGMILGFFGIIAGIILFVISIQNIGELLP